MTATARIIADSVNPAGQRLTTVQVRYWRAVHSELMTHRHLLAEATGEARDQDTDILHAAHAAWNALARLDLMIRKSEEK